jgi:TolB-like protein
LIYIPEDKQLWSGRYERELRDILQLQGEIAQDIAATAVFELKQRIIAKLQELGVCIKSRERWR